MVVCTYVLYMLVVLNSRVRWFSKNALVNCLESSNSGGEVLKCLRCCWNCILFFGVIGAWQFADMIYTILYIFIYTYYIHYSELFWNMKMPMLCICSAIANRFWYPNGPNIHMIVYIYTYVYIYLHIRLFRHMKTTHFGDVSSRCVMALPKKLQSLSHQQMDKSIPFKFGRGLRLCSQPRNLPHHSHRRSAVSSTSGSAACLGTTRWNTAKTSRKS